MLLFKKQNFSFLEERLKIYKHFQNVQQEQQKAFSSLE